MNGFKVRRPAVGPRLNESGWRESNPHLKAWKACARPSNCTRAKRSAGVGPGVQRPAKRDPAGNDRSVVHPREELGMLSYCLYLMTACASGGVRTPAARLKAGSSALELRRR